MSRVKNGKDMGLEPCPHCGKDVEFFISGNTAFIYCSDHNCLGGSRVSWGTNDTPYIFIEKLKANWNNRCADQNALVKALEYLDKFRNELYQQTQNEDSERWGCCVDTLDEAIDKARMFVL